MATNKFRLDEYESLRPGSWYYTQNKFGTQWFDNVDNQKGWTADFNLTVADIQNSDWILDENSKAKGVGVYVNDGTREEIINFLTQEIIFVNANKSITLDTTLETDYRVVGQDDNLRLFAKQSGETSYSELASVGFLAEATNNGNALKPSAFEDTDGDLHAVWWDDGSAKGKIYYSKYENNQWSTP
jgi:hypothetical protein